MRFVRRQTPTAADPFGCLPRRQGGVAAGLPLMMRPGHDGGGRDGGRGGGRSTTGL